MDGVSHRPNALSQYKDVKFYGRLLEIYEITLPATAELFLEEPYTFLLGRIRPCSTEAGPIPGFPRFNRHIHASAAPEVIDLGTVEAVVGRIEVERWAYIVDRSSGEHPTVFGEVGDDGTA